MIAMKLRRIPMPCISFLSHLNNALCVLSLLNQCGRTSEYGGANTFGDCASIARSRKESVNQIVRASASGLKNGQFVVDLCVTWLRQQLRSDCRLSNST